MSVGSGVLLSELRGGTLKQVSKHLKNTGPNTDLASSEASPRCASVYSTISLHRTCNNTRALSLSAGWCEVTLFEGALIRALIKDDFRFHFEKRVGTIRNLRWTGAFATSPSRTSLDLKALRKLAHCSPVGAAVGAHHKK